MSRGGKGKKRKFRYKDYQPTDPELHRISEWPPENLGFYTEFRSWLKVTGYSQSSMNWYGEAVRQALAYLNKPYRMIDPDTDLEQVCQHFQERPIASSVKSGYQRGLLKLAEYLRLRQGKPAKPKTIQWDYYLENLPVWLCEDIHAFLLHCKRSWKPDRQHRRTLVTLSYATRCLRWFQARSSLEQPSDLTPERWYEYLDHRLEQGINPKSINDELQILQHLLHFIEERGKTVCKRMFQVDTLAESSNLPRDLPAEQLGLLQRAILDETGPSLPGWRQCMGKMDLAWFLLMLHCGLRTCEVRAMKPGDIDWERQQVRIEQSKGLKDRIVYLSPTTVTALEAYLEVRGPAEALPGNLFIYRHKPLSEFYCGQRLHTYGERCGVYATPHMLRHSCATLLLNSGAPVLTVQMILGHKWVDTTLGYARLYDGTVAADYYQAMAVVEHRLALPEDRLAAPWSVGQLLAMLDALRNGALNEEQREIVRQLRAGIMLLAGEERVMRDVTVLDHES